MSEIASNESWPFSPWSSRYCAKPVKSDFAVASQNLSRSEATLAESMSAIVLISISALSLPATSPLSQ